ncbi:MAG: carbohydrate kinase family protein [bacterium]|nr:carbohydrate kinase family protein [bacterium]
MYDILVIGSATRDGFFEGVPFVFLKDKKFRVGKGIALPYGGKVKVPKITFTTGGGGTNTAVTFARQGLKTCCISCIGKDVSGEEVKRGLQAEKVDTRFFQVDKKNPTAYSVIFLTNTGERTILSYKGAGDNISEKLIPWGKLKSKWLYLSSLAGNKNLLIQAINFSGKNDVFLAINPGMGELINLKKSPKLLSNFDIFVLNQEEASFLTNTLFSKEKEIFQKLDDLIRGLVVMTKGPEGVVVSDGANMWRAGIYREKKLVDRTGAGDAFASGFVAALINKKAFKVKNRSVFREKDIEAAIKLASANATSKVEAIGAKTGLLYKKDLANQRWKKLPIEKISL